MIVDVDNFVVVVCVIRIEVILLMMCLRIDG